MIKNYKELTDDEREKVFEFLLRNEETQRSIDDFIKEFMDITYDYGRGVLFQFFKGEVIWKISIVLIDAEIKKSTYCRALEIREDLADKKNILEDILCTSREVSKSYGAEHIYLGTKDEGVIHLLNSMGIFKEYYAFEMTLEDREIKHEPLSLIPLNQDNKNTYLEVYNEAFKDTPNGATIYETHVEGYLKKADENNGFYLVMDNYTEIGFLEYIIEDGIGSFDIGLLEEFRGKGFGRRLLETAINLLNEKHVEEIKITVISKNTLAHEMYKRRGFRESKLYNYWFRL